MKPLTFKRVKRKGRFHGTPYQESLHTPEVFHRMVQECLLKLGKIGRKKFNALAGTGHSGLIMGAVLAEKLGIPLITVRKDDDGSHDYRSNPHKVSGYLTGKTGWRYIIIDDLIESGETVKRIVSKVNAFIKVENEKFVPPNQLPLAKCVGVLLYRCNWRDGDEQQITTEDGPTRIWYRKESEGRG